MFGTKKKTKTKTTLQINVTVYNQSNGVRRLLLELYWITNMIHKAARFHNTKGILGRAEAASA